ncbi:MAG: hypothetical protein JWM66_959, partial [Solirubrobacterales bacterium]|nr:hypothetical protein [Solirubrobacterales bacterium]
MRRAEAGGVPAVALRAGPLVAVLLALPFAGCGGGSSASTAATGSTARTAASNAATAVSAALHATATTTLPQAVQLPAVTPGAGGVLALAGLDAADASLASVTLIDGSSASTVAQLPHALHDAGAATVGGRAYLFGGGNAGSASSSVLEVTR